MNKTPIFLKTIGAGLKPAPTIMGLIDYLETSILYNVDFVEFTLIVHVISL